MKENYVRLVELFVKSDLRDEIKGLKREKTYDEYLRDLIKKNSSPGKRTKNNPIAKKDLMT